MSKFSRLSKPLVEKFAMSQSDANKFVREMFSTIKDNLETDKVVKVKGLGTFRIVETSARESIDVNTKERIVIEARNKLSFAPENAVRNRVNSPFSQFESVEIPADVDFEEIDKKYEEEPKPTPEPTPELEVKEEPVEETDVQPVEEPIKEPIEEPIEKPMEEEVAERKRNYVGIVLVVLGIVIAFGLGYFMGRGMAQKPILTEKTIEESAKEVEKVEETIGEAVEEPIEELAEAPAEQVLDEVEEAPYNSDPRVKTGAYDIVGLDTTLTVLAGQTLKGISRAYLGEGMECYVEAYNNGLKEVSVGDRVKIPRLRMKDNVKKYLKRHIE